MVSIVVPVYNAEDYLEKCIKSILQQTCYEWELILIDNGSTDESYALCRKYAKLDERIFVYHQYRNLGVSAARNLGKEKANGEFVTFIDADDWVKPDFLEKLTKIQKKEQADMVICGYKAVYESDREETAMSEAGEEKAKKRYRIKVYDMEKYIEKYLLKGNTHCWGVLYHKDVLEEVIFPKGISIGEDLLFLIEAALRAKKIAVSDYKGYQYYINEKGAMKKKFTASYMDQILCWKMASEKIVSLYPGLKNKLDSILVVSAMLVAGKLAELEKEERSEYTKEMEECRKIVKEYGSKKEVVKLLPRGYSLKCILFRYVPGVYMELYSKIRMKR